MYLEVDPRGDTLITLQDPNPSSPSDTAKEAASDIQFLVSKKHLVLASPRAGKVLEGSFKEATPGEDGLFHWKFEPIFDTKAFETVMKIIHGQTRGISSKISLPLLAQITAIVDDLECHNAVWFFAKGWISQIKNQIPWEICEDLMRWILISYVFEQSKLFTQVTATAIRYSTDVIPDFNLPIRPKVLEGIRVKRENIFQNLVGLLHGLEDQLLGQSIGCNQGCRAMMLGTLSQGLRSSSLLPFPSSPYISLSISSTLQKLRATESLDYYCTSQESTSQKETLTWTLQMDSLTRRRLISSGQCNEETIQKAPLELVRDNCRLEHHLNILLNTTNSEIQGLELAKYLDV
ncbi:hypothetical protein Trisim1_012432 [Trichoderma cf. simile WF8]